MNYMRYVFKNQLDRLVYMLIPSAERRSARLKKRKFFAEIGENVHFQPRKLPADPKFIKLHNNIKVASDVTFVTHDIIHKLLNDIYPNEDKSFKIHCGCIEIMDNVFIGSGTIIMPDVRIGSNVIVAAGSLITKDVPDGSVVAGIPARCIGKFDDIVAKRRLEKQDIGDYEVEDLESRVGTAWELFEAKRNQG